MEPRFQVTAPAYVIRVGEGLQTAFTETGIMFVPIFTDDDLAQRWIAENQIANGRLQDFPTTDDVKEFLQALKNAGYRHVGYDPTGASKAGRYQVFGIDTAIRDIDG